MRLAFAFVTLALVLASCEPCDMALPTSREETATPASPVSSNTTNAIQDAIIGRKFPRHTRWSPPRPGNIETNITFSSGGQITASADAGGLTQALEVSAGDTFYGLKMRMTNAGGAPAGTWRLRLWEVRDLTQNIRGDQLVIVDPPAAWDTYSVEFAVPYTALDEYAYYLEIVLAKLSSKVNSIGYEVGRL